MKVQHAALRCNSCGETIYSRCDDDRRSCKCKTCSVDGGFRFCRFIGSGKVVILTLVGANPKLSLWIDWNSNCNKYGLIKDSKEKGITICMK